MKNLSIDLCIVAAFSAACLPGAAATGNRSNENAPLPPRVAWEQERGRATLTNGSLELIVETRAGLNARSLRDAKSGAVFADRDYSWVGGAFPAPSGAPVITEQEDGSRAIAFRGRLGAIEVEQAFAAPAGQPGVILERITIRNPTAAPVPTADFKCGFAKCVRTGETWATDADAARFCPVPYRRETDGHMQEFPLREVAEHGTAYAGWFEAPVTTPIWGAEGWVWTKGAQSFLLAKHNDDSMEWSLMEPERRGAETVIRFGGAGRWKHGHPEAAAQLAPGASYRFGETRLQAIGGIWQQAFYAYRGYVEAKGCRTPKGYDPPIHWNELYDNEYYSKVCALCEVYLKPDRPGPLFGADFTEKNNALLRRYYSLELMRGEAAKAKELGGEALYLDPGWDTGPGHQVWDAARLGSMESFVKTVKEEYGLRAVSLWCSLAGVPPTYGDPNACPPQARVIGKDGVPAEYLLCLSSPAYLDTKTERLLEVCRNGAAFLMFDSNQFSGPCYDKTHGHAIPSTREDHARALLELTRRIKVKYPRVLIEMHDFITGPSGIHYTPTYYGYARPSSFDCLWGHEFMWNPMDDVRSRRAVSLYYYNLAYSIPLYLHVNLKSDNENALVFWWFASTCRHLGVGGKAEGRVWEAHKSAMQTYKPLKRFYTQGVFYGLDETIHAHTLPELGQAVINCFNLDDKPAQRTLELRAADIGLSAGALRIEGAPFRADGDAVSVELSIPARGHRLLEVRVERAAPLSDRVRGASAGQWHTEPFSDPAFAERWGHGDTNGAHNVIDVDSSAITEGTPAIRLVTNSGFDVAGLNFTKGHRRGFYGEYLFCLPDKSSLALTIGGAPLTNAEVSVYQKNMDTGDMEGPPVHTGTTDAAGLLPLANLPVPKEYTTATGCTLHPNPFGYPDVVGRNGLFLVRARSAGTWYYGFVTIGAFVCEYARGHKDSAVCRVELKPE